jgi:WD40 repeat protein
MSEQGPFIIQQSGGFASVVLDDYVDPQLPKPALIRAGVNEVAAALQQLGFERDGDLAGDGLSPTVRREFQVWKPRSRRIVLYWAGHGRPEGVDNFYLYCRDTVGRPATWNAISAQELGEWLADKQVDAIVLVVDACNSGGGAREIFTEFDKRIENRAYPPGSRPRLAVISAAQRHQAAHETVFTRALIEVLEHGPPPATESYLPWGDRDEFITPTELADAIAEKLRLDGIDQSPECKGAVGNFFRNKRVAASPDMEVEAKRRRGAWLPADVRQHFMAKFRGIDSADEQGWYFNGRDQPLRDIIGWLRTTDSGLLVVTGPPGCGKSAVLGRLAVLSDEAYRNEAAQAGALEGVNEDTDPGISAISAGIHAKNKTLLDCVTELGSALELRPPYRGWQSAAEIAIALNRLKKPRTILLDALDEARPADQILIARDLLRQLADLSNVRVIVGTRPDRARPDQTLPETITTTGPLLRALAPDKLVALDEDPDAVSAIATYVQRRLQRIPGSPYSANPQKAQEAAVAIADRSDRIFLFGRLLARIFGRASEILDLSSADTQRLLHGGVADAFADDLARYGDDEQRVRDLLTPLAFAEGAGLPRRDVWLATANSLTVNNQSRRYDDADLAWILEHAGAHLIEAGEDGQTVYRLYHQAFNDYLKGGRIEDEAQSRIADGLLRLVGPVAIRDWAIANPYLHRHLATHVAAADRLAELVTDSRYLLYADPLRLARVLGSIDYRPYPLVRLYSRAVRRLDEATVVDRAATLQTTALNDEPQALSLLHTEAELPWRGLWASGPPTSFHRVFHGHGGTVNAVVVTQIGLQTAIVSGGTDGTLRIWDALTGEQEASLRSDSGSIIHSVAVGQVSGRPVIVADAGDIVVWDASGEKLMVLSGHAGGTEALAIGQMPGCAVIASGRRDNSIQAWDAMTGDELWRRRSSTNVKALAVGEGAGRLLVASGSVDGTLNVRDAITGEEHWWTRSSTGVDAIAVGEVAGHPLIACGGYDGKVRVWDAATGQEHAVLSDHTAWVRALAFGQVAGGTMIVASGSSGAVRIWDAATGILANMVQSAAADVLAVTVGQVAGHAVIVTGDVNGTVRLWDADEEIDRSPDQTRRALTVAIGHLARRATIVVGYGDGRIRLWNASTGNWQSSLPGHEAAVLSVAIGRVGRRPVVVSCGRDHKIHVWDTTVGEEFVTLDRQTDNPLTVAIAQVARRPVIIGGHSDGSIRIWDAATGKQQASLPAHRSDVLSVAIGKVGRRPVVVSCSRDGTLRLWEPITGWRHTISSGHSDWTGQVAVGQAGRRTVVALTSENRIQAVEVLRLGSKLETSPPYIATDVPAQPP